MTTPFPYPDLDTLTPQLREAVTSRASLNVYRMIAHSPGLAPSFLTMASDVLQHNSLPPSWRELVILRVGYRYQADYEIHHHLNIARAVGLSDDAIAAADSGSGHGLSEQEAAMLRLTDLLLDEHTLSDDQRTDALRLLTANQLADFTLTVGFYQLVCNFLNTFGVAPEGEGTRV
jgi:4-carboxymuconolactone decarboxylase